MMVISKFGIELSLLQHSQLELIRGWRNSDAVRGVFEYKKFISKEDHLGWFSKLNPKNNFYFVFSYQDMPLGVVSIKDVDWDLRSGEAGIFLGDTIFVESPIPVVAVIVMMQWAFEVLELEDLYAKIFKENDAAKKFNTALGYQLMDGQDKLDFQRYRVSKADFSGKVKNLVKSLVRAYGPEMIIKYDEDRNQTSTVRTGSNMTDWIEEK
jgi:RimJ/RimL family protein N-acetyltransferase